MGTTGTSALFVLGDVGQDRHAQSGSAATPARPWVSPRRFARQAPAALRSRAPRSWSVSAHDLLRRNGELARAAGRGDPRAGSARLNPPHTQSQQLN